jgi:hypothetical protein
VGPNPHPHSGVVRVTAHLSEVYDHPLCGQRIELGDSFQHPLQSFDLRSGIEDRQTPMGFQEHGRRSVQFTEGYDRIDDRTVDPRS